MSLAWWVTRGLFLLKKVLLYVMSAHREIKSEALSEVSLWACSTTLRTWEGWSRSRFLSPVLLEEGTQLKGRPCILSWKLTGVFSCVVWTWLFYLPPFLTSGRWGSNHCSVSRSCHDKVPVGLTVVWKVSRWEVESGCRRRLGEGECMLASVCGAVLIFILWCHQGRLPACEVTTFLFWPPDCTYFLCTLF